METRANYVLIGAFVLVIIASVFGFIFWLYKSSDGGPRADILVEFPGSVTGLSVGGQVLFNGIRIGSVQSLSFSTDGSPRVVARLQVDESAPLKQDVRAQLSVMGLTGVAYVALSGGSASSPPLFPSEHTPFIKADRSAFEDLVEGARSVLSRADAAFETLETVMKESGPQVQQTIANVEKFSSALASQSDGVQAFLTNVGTAAGAVGRLSDNLEVIVKRADQIVAAVDPAKVTQMVDNVAKFTDGLAQMEGRIESAVGDIGDATGNLRRFSTGVNDILTSISPNAIATIISDVQKVTSSVAAKAGDIQVIVADARTATTNVKTFSESLSRQAPQVDAIVSDARKAAANLDTASAKVLGVIDNASTMFNGADGQGLIKEATGAFREIRIVAAGFAGRSGAIASGLARLAGPGVGAFRSVMDQARQTLTAFSDLAQTLQASPNRIIFGGPDGPRSQPRRQ